MQTQRFRTLPLHLVYLAALITGCAPSLETGCKRDDDCTHGICSAGICARPPDAVVMGDARGRDTGSDAPSMTDAEPSLDAIAAGGGFTKPDGSAPPVPDAVVPVSCEGAGMPCSNEMLGVCRTFGFIECQADGSQSCNAPMAFGTDEICDGLDNDCNGQIDDRVNIWCFGANPALEGRGVCRAGYRTCDNGTAGDVCNQEVLPSDEICNGLDDDCDGETDEHVDGAPCAPEGLDDPTIQAVLNETGVCRPGTRACVGGEPGECIGAFLPAAFDDCNGLDDDCDGELDEDCTCVQDNPCGDWRPEPCQQGVLDCDRPPGQMCVGLVLPAAFDDCNGVDDDCNGVIDDLLDSACYTGAAATRNVGACRSGTRTCNAGVPGACVDEVLPRVEACNGVDDDCDGQIDEGFDGLGESCAVGMGQCRVDSFGDCSADGRSVVCPVSPDAPQAEFCDGVDNDCDGVVDEDSDMRCYSGPEPVLGQCRAGVSRCIEGVLRACEGEVLPQAAEVCDEDADDENCNGEYNEGCACDVGTSKPCGEVVAGTGVCRLGRSECTAAGVFGPCVGAINPSIETCNDLDDDCDGETDEGGLVEDCYMGADPHEIGVGSCRSGIAACNDGDFDECFGAVTPVAEICNATDDDCDGTVDEDLVSVRCETGEPGICALGRTRCGANGVTDCARQQGPSPEVCNRRDDNCDAQVDNLAPVFGPVIIDAAGVAGAPAEPVGVALAWSESARRYAAATIHAGANGQATVQVRLVSSQGALSPANDVVQGLSSDLRQVRIAALPAINPADRVAFVVAWLEARAGQQPVLHLRHIQDDGTIGVHTAVVPALDEAASWKSFDMVANGNGLTVFGAVDRLNFLGANRSLQLVRLSFDGTVQWRHAIGGENTTPFARDVAIAATTSGGLDYYGLIWTQDGAAATAAYFALGSVNQNDPTFGEPVQLVGPAPNAPRIAQDVHARSDGFLAAFLESSGSHNIVIQRFGFDGGFGGFEDAQGRSHNYTIAATGDRAKSGTVLATLPNQDVGVIWREVNNANGSVASLRYRRANSDVVWLPGNVTAIASVGQAPAGPAVARDGLGILYPTQEANVPTVVVKMIDGEVGCPASP